jgi:hypothetical protein
MTVRVNAETGDFITLIPNATKRIEGIIADQATKKTGTP